MTQISGTSRKKLKILGSGMLRTERDRDLKHEVENMEDAMSAQMPGPPAQISLSPRPP
jgi:hypothetical protein